MKNKWISLVLSLGIGLGMCSQGYAYVMVRSGFGELKHDGDIGSFNKQAGTDPTWRVRAGNNGGENDDNMVFQNAHSLSRNNMCTKGKFEYKNHHNLSVALGGRFDVLDIGAIGIELEVLGGYANFKNKKRDLIPFELPAGVPEVGGEPAFVDVWNRHDMPEFERPDFLMVEYKKWGEAKIVQFKPMYLSNQRIAGAQINIYWEQYVLDWLSVGIGGGIGGAYICTKFSIREMYRVLDIEHFDAGGGHAVDHFVWKSKNTPITRSKYVHTGSLLYNFTLFARAEKFETLFEVGYRHIGLHQMFGGKLYGYEINKLGNMYSDQIYLGLGRTF